MRAIALGLVMLLAACSVGGQSPTPDGLIAHPDGDELVFGIEHRGGFMPVDFAFATVPAFTLLGDGRVIVPGAQIDLFPGPALPALNVRRLTEEGMQAVLRDIAAGGQFAADAEWRGAQNFVADAADTVLTLQAADREVTVVVYGLGTVIPGDNPPGMEAAELAAHQALSALVDRLTGLDVSLAASAWADADWQPYQPQAMRLLVRNADGDEPEPGLENQLVEWPMAGDPAAFGEPSAFPEQARCGVVTGADAEAWLDALSQANQLTRFTAADHRYAVSARPLLPHEPEACPAEI